MPMGHTSTGRHGGGGGGGGRGRGGHGRGGHGRGSRGVSTISFLGYPNYYYQQPAINTRYNALVAYLALLLRQERERQQQQPAVATPSEDAQALRDAYAIVWQHASLTNSDPNLIAWLKSQLDGLTYGSAL